MVSTMASSSLPTPFRPDRTWSAGRESSTLGVEISVALRMVTFQLWPETPDWERVSTRADSSWM